MYNKDSTFSISNKILHAFTSIKSNTERLFLLMDKDYYWFGLLRRSSQKKIKKKEKNKNE